MTRIFTGKRLVAAALLTLSVGTSSSLISFADGASAAATKTVAPKLGGPCITAGATTTVGGKVLTCSKALSGKLAWGVATSPSLPGGHPAGAEGRGPNGGGPNGSGPNGDPAFAAAMTKYTACLKAQGVTLPAFGGRRGFGGAGATPGATPRAGATPAPRPTLSAKQQAAMTKCASLRPSIGRGFGQGAGGAPGTPGMGSGFGGGAQLPNTPANVAAYIACLNTNGVNIATLTDIAGLDRQSPKISAALAACRSKRVVSN